MPKKLTKKEFIEKSKLKHDDKYDYSLVEYKNIKTEVIIKCKLHNILFKQKPENHIDYDGCPICQKENRSLKSKGRVSKLRKKQENVIKDLKNKYGENFDYSNVEYINSQIPVKLICNRCFRTVYFKTAQMNYIKDPCSHCSHIEAQSEKRLTTEQFIEKAKQIHNDKYDYSLVDYKNSRTNVTLICNGCKRTFSMNPRTHLEGHGCSCYANHNAATKEEFIKKAEKVHFKAYDYSLVEYKNNKTKVKIKCNECGYIFEQEPRCHTSGEGCPNCSSSYGKKVIRSFLDYYNIPFIKEKIFDDFKSEKGGCYRYDFYLTDRNIIIEYNGLQHYKPVKRFGGEKQFKETVKNDIIKEEYCKQHNIPLHIIKYDENILERLSVILGIVL